MMISPIYPCLWFEKDAIDAAKFYLDIFPNSEILSENPWVVYFTLNGSTIMLLNGGKAHQLSEAVSLVVECDTQEEIDYYWAKLLQNGGQEKVCGWLTDQFGVSWQVFPRFLIDKLNNPDTAPKVFEAFQDMVKFDIEKLKKALE